MFHPHDKSIPAGLNAVRMQTPKGHRKAPICQLQNDFNLRLIVIAYILCWIIIALVQHLYTCFHHNLFLLVSVRSTWLILF